jgi:large subunit ribosomal protein L32
MPIKHPALVRCPNCAGYKLSHFVCPHCGWYKGSEVVKIKVKKESSAA